MNNNKVHALNNKKGSVQIETQTHPNNNYTNIHQLSSNSNLSYQILSSFEIIDKYKKTLLLTIEKSQNVHLVEILGGLADNQYKLQQIQQYGIIWKEILELLTSIQNKILCMTFENDLIYPGTQEYVSDIIINSIKEINEIYNDLIQQSTLRYLDTVCVTHNLKYKESINLQFDIKKWVQLSTEHIKKTQINKNKPTQIKSSCFQCLFAKQVKKK